MRSVLLASLRTHTRRYVAALLAVVIGVVFIVVTAALSSAVRDGLTSGLDAPYAGADAVVDRPEPHQAVDLMDGAAERGADAWLIAWTLQPVAHDGEVLNDSADIGQLPEPEHRWQLLEEGSWPTGRGQAVADANAAEVAGIEVGDRVRVGSGKDATEVEVVGLAESPSTFGFASLYLSWPDLRQWQDSLYVSSVAWAGPGDADDATAAITHLAPDADVMTVDAFVQQVQKEANQGVDLIAIALLVFATIALGVAVLVINNTFAILFAQRAREFALLRCVGATRRQVLRSVRVEALLLGVTAAGVGLAAGTGIGHGLVALIRSQWPDMRLGETDIAATWLLAAAVVGIGVTLVAAWLPTRRVVRISPLAALRPDDSASPRTTTGRLRFAAGVVTVVTGAALLATAMATTTLPVMLAGGAVTFTGVLVLGPVLVPALIRGAGLATGRVLGVAGRLASGNAVRNPKRTAATTAALLVGVTLTTAVLTTMATSRAALADEMDRQHPIDIALTGETTVPADLADRVAAVGGVASSVSVAGTTAEVEGLGDRPVLTAPASAPEVLRGDVSLVPADGRIKLPYDALGDGVESGDRVTVSAGGREVRLRVVGGEGWGGAALVSPATLARLDPSAETQAIWLRAEDGADADDLASAVEALAGPAGAEVENGLTKRQYVDLQLDVMTGGVIGLLGIAVVIALIGIANTLGLSVLERGREHALMRALGLTRRQLRTMLGLEAVLLSVVATLLGTGLGVTFAWAAVQTVVQPVIETAPLVLPVGQLALMVLASAVAGLLACVLPARRAARVAPAAGLALE